MRAVLHFKNAHLSWKMVLNHFKFYGATMNSSTVQNINKKEKIITPRGYDWPDRRLGVFTKSITSFPLPGNVSTINELSQSSALVDNKKCDHVDLFSDRFSEQMSIIEQMTQYNDDCLEANISVTEETLEGTVHSCLAPLRRELKDLFPGKNLTSAECVLSVICLNHHTKANMATWDSSVAQERESLAELFVSSAKHICASLNQCGYWADFIDPYSGAPFAGPHTNDTLFETDPRMRHFGLQVRDLGCCKVLCHPQWHENVFTGLIFTDAPATHPSLASLGCDSSTLL